MAVAAAMAATAAKAVGAATAAVAATVAVAGREAGPAAVAVVGRAAGLEASGPAPHRGHHGLGPGRRRQVRRRASHVGHGCQGGCGGHGGWEPWRVMAAEATTAARAAKGGLRRPKAAGGGWPRRPLRPGWLRRAGRPRRSMAARVAKAATAATASLPRATASRTAGSWIVKSAYEGIARPSSGQALNYPHGNPALSVPGRRPLVPHLSQASGRRRPVNRLVSRPGNRARQRGRGSVGWATWDPDVRDPGCAIA